MTAGFEPSVSGTESPAVSWISPGMSRWCQHLRPVKHDDDPIRWSDYWGTALYAWLVMVNLLLMLDAGPHTSLHIQFAILHLWHGWSQFIASLSGVILHLQQFGLTLKWLGHFFFKIWFHFLMLFILCAIFLYETGPIQWMFSQHCGYWWPGGALAPGHQ